MSCKSPGRTTFHEPTWPGLMPAIWCDVSNRTDSRRILRINGPITVKNGGTVFLARLWALSAWRESVCYPFRWHLDVSEDRDNHEICPMSISPYIWCHWNPRRSTTTAAISSSIQSQNIGCREFLLKMNNAVLNQSGADKKCWNSDYADFTRFTLSLTVETGKSFKNSYFTYGIYQARIKQWPR